MQFGFVGLGQMGAPMAANLAGANDVLVFDLSQDAMEQAAQAGATQAKNVTDFSRVDVLFTCLPTGEVVERSLFDPDTGIAKHLSKNTIVVDTSTIEYAQALRIADQLSALGLRFLDAPVSGMWKRAQEGTLTMMIGGDGALVEVLRSALAAMASRVLHTGDIGTWQLTS